jgi:phage/plasmid-like protein (TIGR03299 family)
MIETMAYVGLKPWHGLGAQLPSQATIDTWAQEAGLNWSILEAPVSYITSSGSEERTLHFPEGKVLFRSDTSAALSVVGKRYKVVQPSEILEFYRDLTEQSGFELETAGVLRGGRKIWALARTGQSTVLKGNDESNGYVLLATACDGTLATTAQFTSVRVVCQNTLAIALQGKDSAVKVPHRCDFDAADVKRRLGISVTAWDNFMYSMKSLSERRVNDAEVSRFLRAVFTSDTKENAVLSERAAATAKRLFDGNGRGAELQSSKGTAFGLLNSVTEFVDHLRRARSIDYRLESAWFGQGAELKRKALEHAVSLIE